MIGLLNQMLTAYVSVKEDVSHVNYMYMFCTIVRESLLTHMCWGLDEHDCGSTTSLVTGKLKTVDGVTTGTAATDI